VSNGIACLRARGSSECNSGPACKPAEHKLLDIYNDNEGKPSWAAPYEGKLLRGCTAVAMGDNGNYDIFYTGTEERGHLYVFVQWRPKKQ